MEGVPRQGKIIDCVQAAQEMVRRGRIHMQAEYVLSVEVENRDGGSVEVIQSEPYVWTVYRVLASSMVDVYTDEKGWNYGIDGFQYKKRRQEPGIFEENPFESGLQRLGDGPEVPVLFLIIAGMMLWKILFA